MKKLLTFLLLGGLLMCMTACSDGAAESGVSNLDSTSVSVSTATAINNTTASRSHTTASRSRTTTTTTTVSTAPVTTTTTKPLPNNNLPTIICWGDSITEGAWMDQSQKYPTYLQEMVGTDNYRVWNAGYGGDGSLAIGARQGAYTVTTKNDITFKRGESTVIIGHRVTGMGLLLDGKTELVKLNANKLNTSSTNWTYTLNANPITINGESYTLGLTYETETKPYTDGKYSVTLVRKNTGSEITIPAGSKVTFANSDLSRNNHCDVYLMGANDGLGNSPDESAVKLLVSRYKKLIDSRQNDRYLVIIPYWTRGYDAAFKEAFGDHAINFRELAVEKGLQTEGLVANSRDNNLLRSGNVPSSLRYGNQGAEQVHLNRYGYHFMATVVYEQGKTLGYWK